MIRYCDCCGYIMPASERLPPELVHCPASADESHVWSATMEPNRLMCRLCGATLGPSGRCSESDDGSHRWAINP